MCDTYYSATLSDGVEFADDYDGDTEGNAREILEKAIEVSPLEFWDQLDITYVDGKVLVDTGEFWHLDFLEKFSRYAKETYLFRLYVEEELDFGNMKVVYDAKYKTSHDEEHHRILDAVAKMDVDTIDEIYASRHDGSILSEEGSKNWHIVSELEDEKKEILMDVFANEENMVRSYLSQQTNDGYIQRGSMVIFVPAEYMDSTFDEQAIDFVRKNNVKETVRLTPPLGDDDTGAADYVYLHAFYKVINNLVEKF